MQLYKLEHKSRLQYHLEPKHPSHPFNVSLVCPNTNALLTVNCQAKYYTFNYYLFATLISHIHVCDGESFREGHFSNVIFSQDVTYSLLTQHS